MAIDITEELRKIREATYGEEVRGSIHDGIKKIADEVEASDMVAVRRGLTEKVYSNDASVHYNVGDYVMYPNMDTGALYICQVPTTGGQERFPDGKWLKVGLADEITNRVEYNNYRFDSTSASSTGILSGKSCDDLITANVWYVNKVAGVDTLTDFPIDGPGWIRVTVTNSNRIMQEVYPSSIETYPYRLFRTKDVRVIDGVSISSWTDWYKVPLTLEDGETHIALQIAEPFNESSSYSANDLVVKNNTLYKFTADHAPGVWTGNDAVATNVAEELKGCTISDEQAQEVIDTWLEEHPEASTTVQDNSLTTAKYIDGSVTADKLEDSLKNQFIDGDYNVTRYANSSGKNTFVYWRHIPAEYEPKVAYSENGVEYAALLANTEGATCAINASRFDVSTNEFYGYFRANGTTVNENDLTVSSNSRQILCYKAGNLISEPVDANTSELDNKKYDWALVGFEDVIVNGQPTERSTPGNTESTDYHPRSFIAQNYDGSYIIGCTDGRSARSQGFRLSDIYSFLMSTGYNVSYAYSLDGGGSVTLVEKGHRVNSYIEDENRAIKSVIYFKKPGAFYNDTLKSATAEIDSNYRSRNMNYEYHTGDIYSYTHDSSSTKQVIFRSLDTFEELGFFRLQANRFFVGVNNGFSHDGSANILLDAGRTNFSWGGASRYLPRLVNSDTDYTDTIPDIPSTGIYRVKITTSEVATSLGLSADDYGDSIYITFRTNANFEILLTRSKVWYRWDKRTWKCLQFVANS